MQQAISPALIAVGNVRRNAGHDASQPVDLNIPLSVNASTGERTPCRPGAVAASATGMHGLSGCNK